MPKKRQSRGRHKGDKGKIRLIQCDNCGKLVPEDKAICVTRMYSPVDPQLARELEKKGAVVMRYPVTKCYCINCAIHYGLIRIRSREERKPKPKVQL